MIKKAYLSQCIIFTLFFQLHAMQKPQPTQEERFKKLKKIVENFDTECETHCYNAPSPCYNFYSNTDEHLQECTRMCNILGKTFKEFNDALNE